MASSHSPLRYPGGKQVLARVLAHLIRLNGHEGGIYAEPYAGGAGAALSLLFGEYVERLMLNDADSSIYAFWDSILRRTDAFLKLLRDTPLTVSEWERQRAVYLKPARHSRLRIGFAAFYLNRCNRSGIICNAGVIGGRAQRGKWKLDARFSRAELAERIRRIALYADRIELYNHDAIDFLRECVARKHTTRRVLVYLDPPYYVKGSQLYMNYYSPSDHAALARYLRTRARFDWVMSYDNVPEIRALYGGLRQVPFTLGYSARDWRLGKEVMVVGPGLAFPETWRRRIPARYISAADGVQIPLAG